MLCTSARWQIVSTGMYVRVPVMFFHSNGSQRLEVSRTCLSYEGGPDGLKASDARLEFEMAQRYFNSTLTSPNAMCNCQCGRGGVEVIMKKLSDHEILSRKFTFM